MYCARVSALNIAVSLATLREETSRDAESQVARVRGRLREEGVDLLGA